MGELPSQQPPDWWNMTGPCFARTLSISTSAAGVASAVGDADVQPMEPVGPG